MGEASLLLPSEGGPLGPSWTQASGQPFRRRLVISELECRGPLRRSAPRIQCWPGQCHRLFFLFAQRFAPLAVNTAWRAWASVGAQAQNSALCESAGRPSDAAL